MKRLTIKLQVTILCTLLAAAAATVALGAMLGNEQRLLKNYYRNSLLSTARLAEDDIRYENGDLDIDRNLDDLPNVRVALFSRYGDLLYGHQRFDKAFEVDEVTQAVGADGTRWYVYDVLLTFESNADIYLRCYMPAHAADNVLGARSDFLWMLLPVLVLLEALGGYGIAKRAFRPVSRIVETAKGISDGSDLKKRIALNGANDEIYRMASVFDDMLERLERAFERERRFTADVSHELRTPIAAILAQSEFALSEMADDEDRREALEEIDSRARYISELIQKLLMLARMDAGQVPMRVEPVDLTELAGTVAQALKEQAAQKRIQIEAGHGNGAAIMAMADETLLLQAALNLAGNAVRYGREGGYVRISAGKREGKVYLSVEDDGKGIAPEDITHIFERFYQADKSRNGKGAGLGLALAECIVRLHGGQMQVESKLDIGSRFTMILPEMEAKE